METKQEYLRREEAWLEAMDGAPASQKANIRYWVMTERHAWGMPSPE